MQTVTSIGHLIEIKSLVYLSDMIMLLEIQSACGYSLCHGSCSMNNLIQDLKISLVPSYELDYLSFSCIIFMIQYKNFAKLQVSLGFKTRVQDGGTSRFPIVTILT